MPARSLAPIGARAAALRGSAAVLCVRRLAAAGWFVLLAPFAAAAAPAAPPSPDTVVETQLAPRAVKAQVARLQRAATGDAATRSARARELIVAARSSGDLRLLGYAEAQLGTLDDADALVLRATIAQSQHRFDEARALLDRVLAEHVLPDSTHAQALLTRAAILQVQGRAAEALRDCTALAALAPLPGEICTAATEGASGAVPHALQRLEAAARSAQVRSWALSLAGELHLQSGRPTQAVTLLRAALAREDEPYTRVLLADALLEAQRPDEVEPLLAAAPPTDAVLLRRWIAAQRGGSVTATRAAALQASLEARFAADAARGAPLHLREAGRFALERQRTAEALKLAQANWRSQRESADALLLAQAARAAGDAATIDALRRWLATSGLRDARIEQALARGAA